MLSKFDMLPIEGKLVVVNLDIMRSPLFARLSGIVMMGKREFTSISTAATNGRDVVYGKEFMSKLSRKQFRWVVLHENFHKALKHCAEMYARMMKLDHRTANKAADFVVNGMIRRSDPKREFADPEDMPSPAIVWDDPQYDDLSFVEIFRILYAKKQDAEDRGEASDEGGFDDHEPEPPDLPEDWNETIDEAITQGEIIEKELRRRAGMDGSGGAIDFKYASRRKTDYKTPLREFLTANATGRDTPRSKLNARVYSATGGAVILPSLLSESCEELLVAADTSGSMEGVYPIMFGEIVRAAQLMKPKLLRLLWWDTKIAGEQTFDMRNLNDLASALKPRGGGGTTPSCVVSYVEQKKYRPQAIIWMTDGYFGAEPVAHIKRPQLWVVIDNPRYTAPVGKTLHVSKYELGE
jgi:predicted metal-dependent peptidase